METIPRRPKISARFPALRSTSVPLVEKLALDMIAAMLSPGVKQKMADLGSSMVASRPEEFRAFVAQEIDQWAEAVRISGAQVD